jgi:hypothetical protein
MEEAMKHKGNYEPGFLYKTTRHWILRAEEMQTLAEEANDPTGRRMMLRIAAAYNWLAEKVDGRPAKDSVMFKRNDDHNPHRAAHDSAAEEPKQGLSLREMVL